MVYREGEESENVYIIKQGEFEVTKKFVRHEVKEVDVSKYLSNSFQFQQENKQQQKQQTGSLENHSSLQSIVASVIDGAQGSQQRD